MISGTRRIFLKQLGVLSGLAPLARIRTARASPAGVSAEQLAVLVDTTRCVGCRECEKACNETHAELPEKPGSSFSDESVFLRHRRMDAGSYTVVNRYESDRTPGGYGYAKFQCMHCLEPACVSACIVGAFTREANGAVVYDAWKCIGCRYCMAACPFQVPAYEFGNAFTPQVRKCTFCFQERLVQGEVPACVAACPMETMTFGRRSDVIAVARERISKYPRRYVPHIYGEHEVGGTSWLYITSEPFDAIGLPELGYHPAPGYTEPIQHALFKWFLPPAALYALLGAVMWFFNKREHTDTEKSRQ